MSPSGPIAFLITDISSGGIVARIRKWTDELASRGWRVEVHTLHDRSSLYTPKIKTETFPHAQLIEHTFDSLDKNERITHALLMDQSLLASCAIISSTFTRAGLLVNKLQKQGWQGCYIEVIPSDNDDVIQPNLGNLRICNVMGAVSSDIAAKLRTRFPDKPVLILPGGVTFLPIVAVRSRPGVDRLPLKICYAGRMDPIQKRIFDLPIIASKLEQLGIPCQWYLAGTGSHLAELKNRFSSIQLTHAPEFTGQLDAHKLRHLLCSCHAFVLPSAFEGLSNSLCEASEAGAVPVATRISGSLDVISPGVSGFIHEVGDVKGISQSIACLYDGALWERMSQAAREKAKNELSISRSIDKILDAITNYNRAGNSSVLESGRQPDRSFYQSILESPLVPNIIARLTRRFWRSIRGKPHDIAHK